MADEASLEGSNGNEKSSVDTLVKLGTSGFLRVEVGCGRLGWKKCVKILLFIHIVYIYIQNGSYNFCIFTYTYYECMILS